MATTFEFGSRRVRLDFEDAHLRLGLGTHELLVVVSVEAPWVLDEGQSQEASLTVLAHVEIGQTYGRHALATVQETFRLFGYPSQQKLRIILDDEQIFAIEEARRGAGVEVLLNISATLFDRDVTVRDSQETYRISVERWQQLLHQAGIGATVVVRVAGPMIDTAAQPASTPMGPSAARAASRLREARQSFQDGRYESCVQTCRFVLENLRELQPAITAVADADVKPRGRDQQERWAALFSDVYSLASGANHDEGATADFEWSRLDAQALLATTAGLLARAMPV